MSGLFGSTTIKGTRITDFAQTSAEVGVAIPFGYGRFPVTGNVIFAPLPPKEHRKVQKQGKGGVKQETFTYTLSYAVSFCQGPIYGFWWIKRNGKTVWTQDPAVPLEDAQYATRWAQRATMYWGTPTQMPDSTIESYEGSGQVSAFRYLAYIVVEDDDVTDQGGAVPSYEACVIASPPEIFLASKPYAYIETNSLAGTSSFRQAESYQDPIDNLELESSFLAGGVRNVLQTYQTLPEELTNSSLFLAGNVDTVLQRLDTGFDELGLTSGFLAGSIEDVLLRYLNYQPESIEATSTFLSGTLT